MGRKQAVSDIPANRLNMTTAATHSVSSSDDGRAPSSQTRPSSSYRQALRSSAIVGGASAATLLISLVRVKVMALLHLQPEHAPERNVKGVAKRLASTRKAGELPLEGRLGRLVRWWQVMGNSLEAAA